MSGLYYDTTKSSDTWITPRGIIDNLGPFDLDPCCPEKMPWDTARRMVTPEEDGLSIEWSGRVWLNPPYSQPGPWVERMAKHNNGVLLVFCRMETRWFQDWVFPFASSFFFPRGRLKFCREGGVEGGSAVAPSVFAAYGDNNKECLEGLGDLLGGGWLA